MIHDAYFFVFIFVVCIISLFNNCKVDMHMTEIYQLLAQLGIVSKYRGYQMLAFAIQLFLTNPNGPPSLKSLYIDLSMLVKRSPSAIERDLRTVIAVAWQHNRQFLIQHSPCLLTHAPSVMLFLEILTIYLLHQKNGNTSSHNRRTAFSSETFSPYQP